MLAQPDRDASGMPSRRRLGVPGLGIIRSLTGRDLKRRTLRSSRSSAKHHVTEEDSSSVSLHSTPADGAPRLPRTRSQDTTRKGGIDDEVVQVNRTDDGVLGRRLVQLRLHTPVPAARPHRGWGHRSPVLTSGLLPLPKCPCTLGWVASPCGRYSRPRTTTDPPSHPRAISRQQACPFAALDGRRRGGITGWFPRSPSNRSTRQHRRPTPSLDQLAARSGIAA